MGTGVRREGQPEKVHCSAQNLIFMSSLPPSLLPYTALGPLCFLIKLFKLFDGWGGALVTVYAWFTVIALAPVAVLVRVILPDVCSARRSCVLRALVLYWS